VVGEYYVVSEIVRRPCKLFGTEGGPTFSFYRPRCPISAAVISDSWPEHREKE
jgi:hypothetical protein